jgi:alanine racemase
MSRPTRAIIDTQALRHNFQLAQSLAPQANTMVMVKANAYGHGMVEVAQALKDLVPAFGVACIEEAEILRQSGIEQPILLLEGSFTADEVAIAAAQNFWLMVENQPQQQAIIQADLSAPVHLWLKVDTGMHRLGLQPEEVKSAYKALSESANVADNMVVASHFASADDLDNLATQRQTDRFSAMLNSLDTDSLPPQSLANSASVLAHPETHRDWNRPGYMIYGASPFNQPQDNADQLKPVMTLESAVISVRKIATGEAVGYSGKWQAKRPSTIATVAIGYGDGYPRSAPNGTPVMVNGVECPLAGTVSMDMISVDVTDLDAQQPVAIGDRVELWGQQLPVNRVARQCNSIGYELLTRMPARVPRIYR